MVWPIDWGLTINLQSEPVATMSSIGENRENLLATENLSVAFPRGKDIAFAADGVTFALARGRTLGLVGESGSGKSITLRAILGLVPRPGAVVGGHVWWKGRDLVSASPESIREVRGREISLVPQDPSTSLNPVYSVGRQLQDVLRRRLGMAKREGYSRAVELLDEVGIPSAATRARAYPHQLSGGMRQRVSIAMAVACKPELLLADEPTTGVDVTLQDQILSLLVELQEESGMSIVIVSHDLGVIAEMADHIAVMYAGHLVEIGPRERILGRPRHPYTQALLAAAPEIALGERSELVAIPGQTPELTRLPPGCPFQPRCLHARSDCATVSMAIDTSEPHWSACPFVEV